MFYNIGPCSNLLSFQGKFNVINIPMVIYCHFRVVTKAMLLYNTKWWYDHGMVVNYHRKKIDNIGPRVCVFRLYTLFTHYLLIIYSLFTHYLLIIYSLFTHYLLIIYSLFTPYLLIIYSLFTHYLLIIYSYFTHYLLIIYSLFTCYLLIIYSLFTHYLLIIYSLFTHYLLILLIRQPCN